MPRMMVIVATLLAAACTDPSLAITLTDVPAETETLRVTVLELTGTRCDDVSLGRVDADTFSAGVRSVATFPPGGSASLTGIPRLGDKLIVVGAYRNRVLLAAGCSDEAGDVDGDLPIAVALTPTVRLRLTPTVSDPATPPSLVLPATAPANTLTVQTSFRVAAATGDVPLQLFARGPGGEVPYPATAASVGDGSQVLTLAAARPDACTPPASCPAVGPVELVIRAPWAEAPVRLSAYVPAAKFWGAMISAPAAPAWAFLGTAAGAYASAVTGAAGAERLTVFASTGVGPPTQASVDAAGARAVVAFETVTGANAPLAGFVTHGSAGWAFIDPAGTPPSRVSITGVAPLGQVADALVALPRCAGGSSLGIVARTAAAPYVGVANPRNPSGAAVMPALVLALAGLPPADTIEVLDAICADATHPALVVASSTAGVEQVRLITAELVPQVIATPFVGAIAAYGNAYGIAGAVVTPTGLRLGTYRLTSLDTVPVFAPTDLVDHALAGRPTSVQIIDANDDGELDSLAVVDVNGQRRVQVTMGSRDGPITALVVPEFGGQDLVLTAADLRRDGRRELVVASRAGIDAYDLTRPAAP